LTFSSAALSSLSYSLTLASHLVSALAVFARAEAIFSSFEASWFSACRSWRSSVAVRVAEEVRAEEVAVVVAEVSDLSWMERSACLAWECRGREWKERFAFNFTTRDGP
jgi:hypothetical protein